MQSRGLGAGKVPGLHPNDLAALLAKQAVLAEGRKFVLEHIEEQVEKMYDDESNPFRRHPYDRVLTVLRDLKERES